MTRGTNRFGMLIAASIAFALGGTPAAASDSARPEKKQKPRQVHPTGEEDARVPTAEELQADAALEQMLSRSSEGLRVIVGENGMSSVDLEGRFMHVSVAGNRADGTPRVNCVTNRDALAKAKAAPSRPEAGPAAAPKHAPALEEK